MALGGFGASPGSLSYRSERDHAYNSNAYNPSPAPTPRASTRPTTAHPASPGFNQTLGFSRADRGMTRGVANGPRSSTAPLPTTRSPERGPGQTIASPQPLALANTPPISLPDLGVSAPRTPIASPRPINYTPTTHAATSSPTATRATSQYGPPPMRLW